MGARWYDDQLGRWISADSIVPDTANPQSLNRFSYVYNRPCNLLDPSGHCGEGSTPAEGISQERHDRLCEIHRIALELDARTQLSLDDPNFLADVEAMALLFDMVAPFYQHSGLVYYEDYEGFISDLGIVVGGIEVKGNLLQHAISYARGTPLNEIRDQAYRLIGGDDPLSQYYIGYGHFLRSDGVTGFGDEFAQPGQNQVRHFVGGLVTANAFMGLGKQPTLDRETEPYDKALYEEAFMLEAQLPMYSLDGFGNAALRYLSSKDLQVQRGISVEPTGGYRD